MRLLKTIAVIDDVAISNMLEELLIREGYAILRAYSGTEAVPLSSQWVNLVLLNLMLPGLNGEEARPKISGIPIIVVSAKAAVTDKVSLLMNGAADYITKPFDTAEPLARIAVRYSGPRSLGRARNQAGGDKPLTPSAHASHGDQRLSRPLHRAGARPADGRFNLR